jgi:hypothetical protein
VLAADEDFTTEGGTDDEDLVRSVACQLTEAGIEYDMPAPLDTQRSPYGLTNRQVKTRGGVAWHLPIMRGALSRGDIGKISEIMTELLNRFHLKLDPNSTAYRKLGMAVLRADVRAHKALEGRSRGEPIDTLSRTLSLRQPATRCALHSKDGRKNASVVAALWRNTNAQSSHSCSCTAICPLWTSSKYHALKFREALQGIPRSRPGELAKATLPQLVEWRRSHPKAKGLTSETVNKLLGGVQAIAKWAGKNGLTSAGLTRSLK